MKKILKWLLVGAVALTVIGGIVFVIGFASAGFKLEALSAAKYETKRFEESADNVITSIKIDYEDADVAIIFDETATSVTVEYPQKQKKDGENLNVVTVSETAGSLVISEREKFYFWDWIGSFTPKMTVTLPAERAYDLALDLDYGDVVIRGKANVNALVLEMEYGDVNAEGAEIVCANTLRIEIDYGDIELGNAQADKMYLSSEYGDLEVEKAALQAKEVYIEMEHGDVDIDMLQADKAVFEMEYGDVEATLYGEKADYTVQVQIRYGETNIRDVLGGSKLLQITSEHGDIEIDFKK